MPLSSITRTMSCCRSLRCASGVLKASSTSCPYAPHANTISFSSDERNSSSTRKASLIVRPPRAVHATVHHNFPRYSTSFTQLVHRPHTRRRDTIIHYTHNLLPLVHPSCISFPTPDAPAFRSRPTHPASVNWSTLWHGTQHTGQHTQLISLAHNKSAPAHARNPVDTPHTQHTRKYTQLQRETQN